MEGGTGRRMLKMTGEENNTGGMTTRAGPSAEGQQTAEEAVKYEANHERGRGRSCNRVADETRHEK